MMTAAKPSNLVPKLRFPEFRHGPKWDLLTLSSASDVNPSNDGLPESFIYVDLGSVKSSVLIERKEITRDAAPSRAQRLLNRRDIIYQTVRPYQRNNLFFDIDDGHEYVASTGYAQLRAHECPEFLYHLLHADSFVSSVLARCTGSNYPAINPSDLASIPVAVPGMPEQQKIADCFGSLDDLIATQGRKLEALRRHKQGLMQKLFPQPGDTAPRLRFPEFKDAGPWEQLTIGAVADLKSGYAFKSDTYVESGDFKIVTIANVQEGQLDLESTNSIAALPRDIQDHQILKPADILVSMTGNVGRVCLVSIHGLLLNQRVGKIIPRRIDHGFLFQMLNRKEFRSAMQLAATGGAQGNISAGEIRSFVFACPVDPREQRSIADCLSTLDIQIAAQVRKVDGLGQHKQGLIQQLYPSLEGL